MSTWLERELAGNWNKCLYSEEALEAFEALKQTCMSSPVLAFTDYTKDFLLETYALKEGFGSSSFPETRR